ncbi:unnamed protein product [Arabidopsis halleri]
MERLIKIDKTRLSLLLRHHLPLDRKKIKVSINLLNQAEKKKKKRS